MTYKGGVSEDLRLFSRDCISCDSSSESVIRRIPTTCEGGGGCTVGGGGCCSWPGATSAEAGGGCPGI